MEGLIWKQGVVATERTGQRDRERQIFAVSVICDNLMSDAGIAAGDYPRPSDNSSFY